MRGWSDEQLSAEEGIRNMDEWKNTMKLTKAERKRDKCEDDGMKGFVTE